MIILLFSFTNFLSNLKISTPYQEIKSNVLPTSNVVLAITYIEINKDSSELSKFWEHVFSIRKNMQENKGILGFSIRRSIFSNKAWTLTVWENESFLEDFVESQRHRKAIRESKGVILKTKFYRSNRKYSDIPISWEEAEILVEKEGNEY